ncbi:MAG TPA: cofactor-independent phosphoglycerate mutase [Dehalococcoidia bacterium]|nr:cofactor-independent phosphoglycerate mutase [Dehalococcoidia bacterium]
MKYCILIIDGASGWPLPERDGKTCLELAHLPNLNTMAQQGLLGLTRTVPQGMEPSSACACMSILGYDPKVYYKGRGAIEAASMGISLEEDEVVFRCNLVAVKDGKMWSYSAGFISNEEAYALVAALQDSLGSDEVRFYPGVSYRHLCTIKGHRDTLQATCIPPHDISDKPIAPFLPRGPGSEFLRDLMMRSQAVLQDHPVNVRRRARGDIPATMIWLFWASGEIPALPPFRQLYGQAAAMTSGVDLLRGLAKMAQVENLDIPGVTDGPDNNHAGQVAGALDALQEKDLVIVHIEAPDEAAHTGSIDDKIRTIEHIDREGVNQLLSWGNRGLRVLVLPDHSTPIQIKTHCADPVPFILWGEGISHNGARAFTEAQAQGTGLFIVEGHHIMGKLIAQ